MSQQGKTKDTRRENAMILVVFSLVVIMEDKVKTLLSVGVAAAYAVQNPAFFDKIAAASSPLCTNQ